MAKMNKSEMLGPRTKGIIRESCFPERDPFLGNGKQRGEERKEFSLLGKT
jgi:hypothetical protein